MAGFSGFDGSHFQHFSSLFTWRGRHEPNLTRSEALYPGLTVAPPGCADLPAPGRRARSFVREAHLVAAGSLRSSSSRLRPLYADGQPPTGNVRSIATASPDCDDPRPAIWRGSSPIGMFPLVQRITNDTAPGADHARDDPNCHVIWPQLGSGWPSGARPTTPGRRRHQERRGHCWPNRTLRSESLRTVKQSGYSDSSVTPPHATIDPGPRLAFC